MYFYLFYNDEGKVVGYLQSEHTGAYYNARQVTKEEYILAGGRYVAPISKPEPQPSEDITVLTEKVDELEGAVTTLMEGILNEP